MSFSARRINAGHYICPQSVPYLGGASSVPYRTLECLSRLGGLMLVIISVRSLYLIYEELRLFRIGLSNVFLGSEE